MCDFFGSLIPIVAITTVFGVPAAIIITLSVLKYRQKMQLIRSGMAPAGDLPGYPGRSPLLWGTVLTGVSAVGVVLALVNAERDLLNLSILILATGLSLLAYWKVSTPHRQRDIEFFERCWQEGHSVTGPRQ